VLERDEWEAQGSGYRGWALGGEATNEYDARPKDYFRSGFALVSEQIRSRFSSASPLARSRHESS